MRRALALIALVGCGGAPAPPVGLVADEWPTPPLVEGRPGVEACMVARTALGDEQPWMMGCLPEPPARGEDVAGWTMRRGRPSLADIGRPAQNEILFHYAPYGTLDGVYGRLDGTSWQVRYYWDERCRLIEIDADDRVLRVTRPDDTTVVVSDERGSQHFTLDAAGSRLLAYERTQVDRVERLAWELVYEPDRVWVRPTVPNLEHLRAESFYEHGRLVRFEVDLDGDGTLDGFTDYHWGADHLRAVTTPAGVWEVEGNIVYGSESGIRPCGS